MFRFPPNKILVPFDFSDVSKAAWKHAKQLAERFHATLEIVYVEELLPPAAWPYQVSRFDLKLRKEIAAHIRSVIGAVDHIHVTQGDPVVTILRMARRRRYDLIVMGTHGRTGFDHLWMGSVAEAVVRLSSIPVMVAREDPQPIRSILAPVNLTNYSEYGFVYAAEVASALKAGLTALFVAGDAGGFANAKTGLHALIEHLPPEARRRCSPQAQVRKGEGPAVILSAAKEHQMVVLVAHRKSLLKDIVLGMTAERILRFSPVPVLAVPAPKTFYRWDQWSAALAMAGAGK